MTQIAGKVSGVMAAMSVALVEGENVKPKAWSEKEWEKERQKNFHFNSTQRYFSVESKFEIFGFSREKRDVNVWHGGGREEMEKSLKSF